MLAADSLDVVLNPAQREFRRELRTFLTSDRVQASLGPLRTSPGEEAGLLEVYRLLGERGWLAPSWPAQYGGLGRGMVENALVTEEMCLAGVPDDAHVLSIDIVGTFLLHAGTDKQCQRFLPALASGQSIAAVLFTEPDCGSDLSRLTMRADPVDGGWRLQGTKWFSQKTRFADVGLCAVRTSDGPVPFDGITLFLLPLRSPGVLVKQVGALPDDRFHEVVVDGIVLSPDDVVGEVGDGWRLINEMLVLERTGIDFHAKVRRWLDAAGAMLGSGSRADDGAGDDLTGRLIALDAALSAGHALAWRVIADIDEGRPDPARSAMSKWYNTEQAREVVRFCLDVSGMPGLLAGWDPEAIDQGMVERACRYAPTFRLGSGTSEIMLYIVASSMGLL